MKEEHFKVFIESITNYFNDISNIPAELGSPYIKGEESIIDDYRGLIAISGKL